MADEQITTIGRCYVCKRTFGFIPASVTTITIDPETALPPGMTVLGGLREPTPEATARSVEEPICPDCVNRAKQFQESADSPALQFETWRSDPDQR
ncbi:MULTISPECIES: hypothetical protein [unclassified Streptosporangium]|uniref:hypothetical protein n=1 Tax=unclassified Streptosporangium TaxID=2632669 RepID=UPI002E28172D|nr:MULTISPECIES: hypothetical protein [unclassified Streptosporangium]